MVATISVLDPESDPEDFEPDEQAYKLLDFYSGDFLMTFYV